MTHINKDDIIFNRDDIMFGDTVLIQCGKVSIFGILYVSEIFVDVSNASVGVCPKVYKMVSVISNNRIKIFKSGREAFHLYISRLVLVEKYKNPNNFLKSYTYI